MADTGLEELLRDTNETVTKIHTALFGINGDNGFVGSTKLRLDAHANRVNVIEKWMYTLTGGGIVIAFLVAHHLLVFMK